jgi:hypothetical protein
MCRNALQSHSLRSVVRDATRDRELPGRLLAPSQIVRLEFAARVETHGHNNLRHAISPVCRTPSRCCARRFPEFDRVEAREGVATIGLRARPFCRAVTSDAIRHRGVVRGWRATECI